MRRQREDDDEEQAASAAPSTTAAAEVVVIDDDDENEESAKPATAVAVVVAAVREHEWRPPQHVDETLAQVKAVFAARASAAALFQKPLFFDQRLRAARSALRELDVEVVCASRVIEDRGSVFIAFGAVGVSSQSRLAALEKFVRTSIEVIPSKPAHGFMFALAVEKLLPSSSDSSVVAGGGAAAASSQSSSAPTSLADCDWPPEVFAKSQQQQRFASAQTLVIRHEDNDGEEHAERTLRRELDSKAGWRCWGEMLRRGVALVCCRWFGGELLGPRRFDHIAAVTSSAFSELAQNVSV